MASISALATSEAPQGIDSLPMVLERRSSETLSTAPQLDANFFVAEAGHPHGKPTLPYQCLKKGGVTTDVRAVLG